MLETTLLLASRNSKLTVLASKPSAVAPGPGLMLPEMVASALMPVIFKLGVVPPPRMPLMRGQPVSVKAKPMNKSVLSLMGWVGLLELVGKC